jgi:ABC-type molybdenum transport system ATPase subunit/photorepair protein PhrA
VPKELPWLILDDPVQSMDDVHIAHFAALLGCRQGTQGLTPTSDIRRAGGRGRRSSPDGHAPSKAILDDPVQSMDDVHIAHFAALLRTLSKEHGRQVMIYRGELLC